jgi:ferredoxin
MRNTKIFYFTGSGNSLHIARDLSSALGNTELIPIATAINNPIDLTGDRIGIVFPIFWWSLPLVVADFISKIATDKYVFAVATYSIMPGSVLNQAQGMLHSNNTKLSAGFCIAMPESAIFAADAFSVAKQKKRFLEANKRIREIAEIIKQENEHRIETSIFFINWIFSDVVGKYFAQKIKDSDTAFWVDKKCNSCGICEKICPVRNIEIIDGYPKWQHTCEQCMACIQWCPQEAIQIGKKTLKRTRYSNPHIKLQDMILR